MSYVQRANPRVQNLHEVSANTQLMMLCAMMKNLPYEVIVWHRKDSSPSGLQERIIASAGRSPDDGVLMDGFQDMHWGFHTAEAATSFAESLFEVVASDDVVLFAVSAKRDENFGRRVYKDTRSTIQSTTSK